MYFNALGLNSTFDYGTGRNSFLGASLFYVLVVLNEKKGKFNEYVINDLDVIQVNQKGAIIFTHREARHFYYSEYIVYSRLFLILRYRNLTSHFFVAQKMTSAL